MSQDTLQERPVTRELVLLGESAPGRRGDRTIIAESQCEFDLPTDEAIDRCIAALKASDENLAQQPDSLYDWQTTWLQRAPDGGGKVLFNVAWYDEQFFQEKKDTFLTPAHLAMYTNIGTDPDSVIVSHWKRVN